ncbi:Na(+)/H(+) antiporter subunit D [Paremcibacter congregatus]|uniref:Na(+)/H(+) antiporter subunit D n=1 Tax=Paremcibacter congregatus TaxID=2043170 RepID=A0A2G4YS69_9PROT|nr:Na(+)/H(+) antiporter subunit D [Paremcibacter congregatus]PHZ85168.1 Na(+)/H(+) antiporter subunit D [Paremcibacter congregatus]QDE27896.1 Na(+)/H(+) antiporter subunit D [Paremcibacter congregatus]
MSDLLPPALILIIGGLLLPAMKGRGRDILVLGVPALTFYFIWAMPEGIRLEVPFLDYMLVPIEVTTLGRLFATVFTLMAFVGGMYALRQATSRELSAAFVYAGGAVGVTFAGDLITMFIFWELMAIGSTLVIWSAGTDQARQAGMRYILMHLMGGVILMVGIIAEISRSGSVDFTAVSLEGIGGWFMLVGILINAAAPPFASWLADSYPEASPSGSVFLSAFTTKTAVYVLMVTFAGTNILIYIGLFMVFYGIIYALLENDMRRILAYSIVNQVGFMVTGIGIGTPLALNGVAAHAFCHIIYKALLLMSAGAVLHQTGKRRCSDLGGLFQSMPFTAACGIIGALAISSFPLTSGFVSKNMISAAAGYEAMTVVYFLLAAASAGVFLHAGIKFPWFVFFQKDSGLRPKDPPINMRIAMGIFAFLCIGIGVYAAPLYNLLPYPVTYEPYKASTVVNYLQLLLFAGLAFFVMLPWMKRTLTITLDADWLYRRLLSRFGNVVWFALVAGYEKGETKIRNRAESLAGLSDMLFNRKGILTKTWMIGTTATWTISLLLLYLVSYVF